MTKVKSQPAIKVETNKPLEFNTYAAFKQGLTTIKDSEISTGFAICDLPVGKYEGKVSEGGKILSYSNSKGESKKLPLIKVKTKEDNSTQFVSFADIKNPPQAGAKVYFIVKEGEEKASKTNPDKFYTPKYCNLVE